MKESQFQSKVRQYIEAKGGIVINIIPTGVGNAGVSDLIICYNGKFIALELKLDTKKYKATNQQIMFLNKVRKAKGLSAILCYNNWENELESILRHNKQEKIPEVDW